MGWLFPLVDGHPPIGWSNAAAYLAMPVLLILSQYLSMALVSPPQNKDDPATAQTQNILKFLPLMIGTKGCFLPLLSHDGTRGALGMSARWVKIRSWGMAHEVRCMWGCSE